jgi:hypothetical protein
VVEAGAHGASFEMQHHRPAIEQQRGAGAVLEFLEPGRVPGKGHVGDDPRLGRVFDRVGFEARFHRHLLGTRPRSAAEQSHVRVAEATN